MFVLPLHLSFPLLSILLLTTRLTDLQLKLFRPYLDPILLLIRVFRRRLPNDLWSSVSGAQVDSIQLFFSRSHRRRHPSQCKLLVLLSVRECHLSVP